jgi:hypothetical protein
MEQQRSFWRLRLRTLMLLVVIVGLVSYIVVERWHRQQEAQQQLAAMQRAAAEAEQARAQAQQIRAFLEAGIESQGPTGQSPTRSTAGERRKDAP